MDVVFSRLKANLRLHRHVVTRVGVVMFATALGLMVIGGAIRVIQAAVREPARPTPSGIATTAWTASLGSSITGLALEENRLYVASDDLTVFPFSCATVAGRCPPRWRNVVSDGPLSVPLFSDERIFSGSADGRLYAFAATCGGEGCTPEWAGDAGEGRVSQPVANFDLVYVTSDELYAFPVGCATEGLECTPAWSADVPGRPAEGPPALGDGLVIVGSSSKRGGVSAYPAVCGTDCEPVWTARFDGRATSVAIDDGSAFTVARGRLLAFSTSCTGRCEPTWRAHFATDGGLATGALSAPILADGRVLVAGTDGRLWVFSSTCDDARCEPTASYDVAATPLLGAVVDGDTALVTSMSGTASIVDLACDPSSTTGPCLPVTVLELGSTALTPALMTADAVIAGAEDGTLLAVGR
jgi:hypothetical protein